MTAAAVAREKAKLYAEFGRRGGEEEGLADDLAPQEFLELEELRKKWATSLCTRQSCLHPPVQHMPA